MSPTLSGEPVTIAFSSDACGLMEIDFDCALGGRASSWRIDGVELLCAHGTDPVENGMYAMAPWAGRLESNSIEFDDVCVQFPATYAQWALHGLVMNRPCDPPIITESADGVQAEFTMNLPGWPFPGTVRTRWTLHERGLHTELEVSSSAAFPAVLGWHPWFRREPLPGITATWSAPGAQLAVRSGAFATGELVALEEASGPFDDAFHVPARTLVLDWAGWGSITVENSHPWFVVFDELPDAVCIEPQTNAPNAMNTRVVAPCEMVRPGEPLVLVTRWRVERDRAAAAG